MNNNEKEALEYLVQLGQDAEKSIKIGGQPYTHLNLKRVLLPSIEPIILHTLDSFIAFYKDTEGWGADCFPMFVHIEDATTVKLIGPVREDSSREVFAIAKAELPREISYGSFGDTENFNINLQSRFVESSDKKLLLKFTGLVKEENVKQTGDDGISQAITIKTGVASIGQAVIPNPVRLAPWRTFQEVSQPESLFVFRMKDGPTAALFEADGGAWRLEAIKNIKEYLEKELDSVVILA